MSTNASPKSLDINSILEAGRKLEAGGLVSQAIDLFREWLKSNANVELSFLIWYEFGRLLQKDGNYVKAESSFRAALEQKPQFVEAMLALGKSLESQGKLDQAIATWQSAIPSEELQIDLLNNIARLMDQTHRPEDAELALVRSLKLNNRQDAVVTTLLQQRQKLCRWPVISEEIGADIEFQKEHIGPLMSLALTDDPKENLGSVNRFLKSKQLDKVVQSPLKRGQFYKNHTKIRVGFLSADFRLHATSIFFAPLIEGLDRKIFEVYLLDITTASDPFFEMRKRLISVADQHVPLQNIDDAAAIARIIESEIDVLVDLSGLTAGARPGIVAARVAPLQMSYIGFLASCGMPSVDYIVTTKDLFPKKNQSGFTEKPLYLEGTYLVVDPNTELQPGVTRAQFNLPEDGMIYCALLNSYKITPEMFGAWMNILKAVPDSVLWLVDENPTTRKNLESYATSHGIDKARLHFSQRVHPAQYRSQLALADLFLDTSPYGNGATARDAVVANLPILTKPGRTMMSRLSAHVMKSMGLKELIVKDIGSYENKAIEIGKNKSMIREIKEKMLASRTTSLLFNTEKFTKDFGDAISYAVNETESW
jgi:predicted O-linked N-acetylglucosamine transferase (SPINDLY family)